MDTYRLSYAPSIHPMLGPSDWPIEHDVDPIEPPIPKPQRGKPKKLRKKGIDEMEPDESDKVTRKGYDVCCGNCDKKAIVLEIAANLKIQTGRSIPRGLGSRSRSRSQQM
jgi:hypothetical protein